MFVHKFFKKSKKINRKLYYTKEKKIQKKEKCGKSNQRNKIKWFSTMSELSLFMWGLKQQSNEENKLEWKIEIIILF